MPTLVRIPENMARKKAPPGAKMALELQRRRYEEGEFLTMCISHKMELFDY